MKKEILKKLNEGFLAIAKLLAEKKMDEAVDEITKQSTVISELIEKEADDAGDQGAGNADATTENEEAAAGEQAADAAAETTENVEEVEKSVKITKAQAEILEKMESWGEPGMAVLCKFVEMYISAGSVPDFLGEFEELKNRLATVEKGSRQNPEKADDEEVKKGQSLGKSMVAAMTS